MHTKNRRNEVLCLSVTFLSSVLMYYLMRFGLSDGINADEISNYFVMEDIFHGNVSLKGWHFSTGLFLMPSLEIYILTKILGFTDNVYYLAGAINYGLMITPIVFIVYRYANNYNLRQKWIYPILIFIFIIVPRMEVYMLNSCTHNLALAVAVWSYLIFDYISRKWCWKLCVGTALLIAINGLISATNTIYDYILIFPMIVVGLLMLRIGSLKKGVILAGSGLISLLISKGIKCWLILQRDGEPLGSTKTEFIRADQIMDSMQATVVSVFKLFWIDIWEYPVFSQETVSSLLGLLIFIKFCVEIKKYVKKQDIMKDTLIIFLGAIVIVNILSDMMSGLAIIHRDVHLYQATLLGLPCLGMVCWLHNIRERQVEIGASLWKWFVIIILLFIMTFPKLSIHRPVNYFDEAVRFLIEHNYTEGVGGYWSSSTSMYQSRKYDYQKLDIHPVERKQNGLLKEMDWMTKGDVEDIDYFIVSDRDFKQFKFTDDDIIDSFGQYKEKLEFGKVNLYLWDHKVHLNCVDKNNILTKYMLFSKEHMLQDDGTVIIKNNEVMYGPYDRFYKGMYKIIVDVEGADNHHLIVTAADGKEKIYDKLLINGVNEFNFQVEDVTDNVEFVVNGNKNSIIHIKYMKIENING